MSKDKNKKNEINEIDYSEHFDLDNPLEYIDMLRADTYEEFIEAMNQSAVHIADKDIYIFKHRNIDGEFEPIMTKKLSNQLNQKLDVEIDGKNKKISKKNIIEENLKKKLKGLIFRPYAINEKYKNNPEFYNLYKNDIKFDKNFKFNISKINPIINHISILCNNNEDYKKYVINWMAHIIKHPNKKTKVCLVFKGLQGSGKSSLWNWFGNNIVGKQWFLNIYDAHHLLDNKFNSELKNKIFTLLDEAQTNGKYIAGNERMKTRITENSIRIEMKGHEAYTIEDKNNYVLLTNNEFPVKIEYSDRRYFCVETSNELIRNENYFNNYFKILEDKEIAKHFYYYLLNIDLENFNPENMPETSLKTDIRVDSAPNPVRFAIDIINDGLTYEETSINELFSGDTDSNVKIADTQKLYKCYKQFVMNKCPGEKMYVYEGFKRKFNELLNIKSEKTKSAGDICMINRKLLIDGIINYFNIKDISEIIKNTLVYDEGYKSN